MQYFWQLRLPLLPRIYPPHLHKLALGIIFTWKQAILRWKNSINKDSGRRVGAGRGVRGREEQEINFEQTETFTIVNKSGFHLRSQA